MQVDLSTNYFELFELPAVFAVDSGRLTTRFRALQKAFHPDRFAAATDAERRWSVQAASFVNDGYQTLGKPLRRAAYLLSLNGISIDEETDTTMDPMFLMEQMELREALEEAQTADEPMDALDSIRKQLRTAMREQALQFEQTADDKKWQQARTVVRQWQFLDKLESELLAIEARLDV
ncbi:MAG: Fe-S protein assembly co-chaperone HscB [Granulosicoccus sp.]